MGRRNRDSATGVGDSSVWMLTSETPFGRLHYLAPPLEMSVTAPGWERASVPLGTTRRSGGEAGGAGGKIFSNRCDLIGGSGFRATLYTASHSYPAT
jgi:hypothetical protein